MRLKSKILLARGENGDILKCAWPGGYPLVFVMGDGSTLCADCLNEAEKEELTGDEYVVEGFVIPYESLVVCEECGEQFGPVYTTESG